MINHTFKPVQLFFVFALSFALLSHCAFANPQQSQVPSKAKQDKILQDVHRFSSTISHVKNFYVEDIKDEKLFEHAIRGMLTGLDPHSTFLNAEEYRDLKVSTSGEYGGLGIEITMDNGYVKVVSPIDDTPAEKAGLKSGDLIIKVGNKAIKGLTLGNSVKLLRGKANTSVVLTVVRPGHDKNPLTFTLKRERIEIKTVKSELIDNDYGYIRISHFQEPTAKLLANAVHDLQKQAKHKLRGLILDLRNNPGGLLDSAIHVSDIFIDNKLDNNHKNSEKMIVFTKGRAVGSEFTAKANPGDLIKGAPIVVLINQGSASGSEIVAGALQDHKRALVVGTKSFGKGSVQTIFPLDDEHAIKLTTARYYTPSGRSIQAEGIEPDIIVENLKFSDLQQVAKQPEYIKEADLIGHLQQQDKNAKVESENKISKKNLIKDDYQLYEALNLLKGLAVLQKHVQR